MQKYSENKKRLSGRFFLLQILRVARNVFISKQRNTGDPATMKAQTLIHLAAAKGYRIGRERRGVYFYGKGNNLWSIACDWRHFVKFVRALP